MIFLKNFWNSNERSNMRIYYSYYCLASRSIIGIFYSFLVWWLTDWTMVRTKAMLIIYHVEIPLRVGRRRVFTTLTSGERRVIGLYKLPFSRFENGNNFPQLAYGGNLDVVHTTIEKGCEVTNSHFSNVFQQYSHKTIRIQCRKSFGWF